MDIGISSLFHVAIYFTQDKIFIGLTSEKVAFCYYTFSSMLNGFAVINNKLTYTQFTFLSLHVHIIY